MTQPISPDLETIEDALKRAAEARPGIAAAYLFGSAAAGRATPISDLDVALVFMPEVTGTERRRLGSEVASALVRDLGDVRPDVRDVETLPLAVRGEVATRGILAASIDDVRRVRFEAETRQRYFDFLPFREATVGPALEALRARHSHG